MSGSRTRVAFIANPQAGGGKAVEVINHLNEIAGKYLGRNWRLYTTKGRGHATQLVEDAITTGYNVIVSISGDGGVSEVVNGMFDTDGNLLNRNSSFGLIPAGTGGDFAKSLHEGFSLPRYLSLLGRKGARKIDLLETTIRDEKKYCVNVAGFGVNGEVVKEVNSMPDYLKSFNGSLAFLIASIKALDIYQPTRTNVNWVDENNQVHSWKGDLRAAFAANGSYCGGGMDVAHQDTSLEDGLVDLSIVPKEMKVLRNLPRLYKGEIENVPGVIAARVKEFTAYSEGEVPVDIDGEHLINGLESKLPLRAKVIPRILPVIGYQR